MKKFFIVFVVIVVSITQAQAQDMFGGNGHNVFYEIIHVSPYVGKNAGYEVYDTLDVLTVASTFLDMTKPKKSEALQDLTHGGFTIRELFNVTVPNDSEYEILEVVRIIGPAGKAVFWFEYIEKSKLKEKLQ